eukprot:4779391-Prymnesium_polylepis.1
MPRVRRALHHEGDHLARSREGQRAVASVREAVDDCLQLELVKVALERERGHTKLVERDEAIAALTETREEALTGRQGELHHRRLAAFGAGTL